MRRADHLPQLPIPLPCMGEPTAASRVSPGSSPARSEASRGAPGYNADAEPDPEPEAEAFAAASKSAAAESPASVEEGATAVP